MAVWANINIGIYSIVVSVCMLRYSIGTRYTWIIDSWALLIFTCSLLPVWIVCCNWLWLFCVKKASRKPNSYGFNQWIWLFSREFLITNHVYMHFTVMEAISLVRLICFCKFDWAYCAVHNCWTTYHYRSKGMCK